MFQNADEVQKYVADNDVKFIDVRFCDLPGVMQHFTIPAATFDPAEELAFDGSSIRGFQAIHESDMALRADLSTARVDPFRRDKTVNINFFIHDPITGEQYSRDPRNIAKKAEAYLASTGFADTAYFGPEAEFYVFDNVRFQTSANESFYHIDSEAGAWNTGSEENNRGYKVRYKGGYFPVPPVDHFADLRAEISLELDKNGLQVERQHHEVGTAGQAEINYKFNTLLAAADDLMLFKYIVKNVAWRNGKTATFMPKPIFGDNGSGMHVHQSLWQGGTPLFYDEQGYAGLSDMARYYIGGILKHAPSLLAFTNPTVNSYHRLVPGFEAPVNMVYSQRNRSAAMRIPITGSNPKAKRVEFRAPDPSSNPYLAFSALLMAGLDGVKNKIEPAEPIDKDLYELAPEEHANVQQVPTSLPAVLEALEADNEYLQAGGVFTSDLIETWIDYKRTHEIAPIQLRPHPHEFELYFDI
ncbi:type I glutamate--ammonia ligase [Streptomyces microflavus]|uniref:Glutamine synthetase n=3 Tax=Streptomyces TaxID=1883 RepID=A0A6N9V2A3_STRMI|nr:MULTISPECIES: type I glutamate--ammonia ligase [Streptomyces]MBK3583058.1 type I glutamate--ammonia ligase [Streptomyces sp. MBT57]AGK76732.1 glutamine synthetase I [Streptomyces microflavus DSM 40593]KAB2590267.1 type I glutamate--ammonia ligase [Streptomyces arboris]MBK5993433.1 type I glutamate--ammonia ligase [Streptomyces sp. MBT58]MBT2380285.1 type I glutamate--ammonia ligase [Streptomyces sp. ISL-111]